MSRGRNSENRTDEILERVAVGEPVVITVDGRAVATLEPIDGRPRSLPASWFVGRLRTAQADPAMRADLARLTPDTTDDLEWWPD